MRAFVATLTAAVLAASFASAQPAADAENDQERLQREQREQLRDLGRQQMAPPGVQVWGMAVDGRGRMMPMGGPGQAQGVPEQIIITGEGRDRVYVIHGYMLRHYLTAPVAPLALQGEADLRTDEELERAVDAGGAFVWPDPAMVPVKATYAPESRTLLVLRGGILRQYSSDLEVLAQFDLRTEREKQGGPRIQIRMQPGPPPDDGPPPPGPDAVREE